MNKPERTKPRGNRASQKLKIITAHEKKSKYSNIIPDFHRDISSELLRFIIIGESSIATKDGTNIKLTPSRPCMRAMGWKPHEKFAFEFDPLTDTMAVSRVPPKPTGMMDFVSKLGNSNRTKLEKKLKEECLLADSKSYAKQIDSHFKEIVKEKKDELIRRERKMMKPDNFENKYGRSFVAKLDKLQILRKKGMEYEDYIDNKKMHEELRNKETLGKITPEDRENIKGLDKLLHKKPKPRPLTRKQKEEYHRLRKVIPEEWDRINEQIDDERRKYHEKMGIKVHNIMANAKLNYSIKLDKVFNEENDYKNENKISSECNHMDSDTQDKINLKIKHPRVNIIIDNNGNITFLGSTNLSDYTEAVRQFEEKYGPKGETPAVKGSKADNINLKGNISKG